MRMEKSVHWFSSAKAQNVCYIVFDVHTAAEQIPTLCAVSIREILELQSVSQSVWTSAKEFDKAVASVQYFY